jgi:anti-anti-sigma factor
MYTVKNGDGIVLVKTPDRLTELVRGTDHVLVNYVEPLVRTSNVTLDCKAIERVDAAGIAALITLYGIAQEAGNTFYVCNLKTHVAEILALVGLDRILVEQESSYSSHSCASFARTAA